MAKNKTKIKNTETVSEEIFESADVTVDTSLFLQEDTESEGFLPDIVEDSMVEENISENELAASADIDLEGSELEGFESAQIDEPEFIENEQAESIIESILFASDRPVSLASISEVFKGTNIKKTHIT